MKRFKNWNARLKPRSGGREAPRMSKSLTLQNKDASGMRLRPLRRFASSRRVCSHHPHVNHNLIPERGTLEIGSAHQIRSKAINKRLTMIGMSLNLLATMEMAVRTAYQYPFPCFSHPSHISSDCMSRVLRISYNFAKFVDTCCPGLGIYSALYLDVAFSRTGLM